MERLDIYSDFDAFEDYFERFEIWAMTKGDVEDVNIVAHFLTFIGKEAYSLLKTGFTEKPISLPYANLKIGRVRRIINQGIENSTTLLRHPNQVRTQRYADNSLRSRVAVNEDGHNSGQFLSCSRFFSFNPCVFRNSKGFKCGENEHIQSVCNTKVHSSATNVKICSCDPIKLGVSIFIHDFESGIELHSRPQLKETQNPCETTVSNQSSYQISYVIILDMVYSNDSHISDEIPYKSKENMLSEPNNDRKPDVVLIDADFSNDVLLCNDIHNKFGERISEESNPDVISNIICLHNAIVSYGKLVQCEAQVLNELEFDYNSDYFISTAVKCYQEVTSNVYSIQCEKHV
ncbi:unnamed protein product [Schistosoma curassoni]|uniref:DUF4806 domain-containing protein n=1 Tax=Schistosoma curassoni TaxID=6186 RepID=A0A183K2T6_9TREM|nr:unnamed protein product [Schistosoma curassoni]